MNSKSSDADRLILSQPKGGWTADPESTLTDLELQAVLEFFSQTDRFDDPQLRETLNRNFQTFFGNVVEEGFIERDGRLEQVPKPSTVAARELNQLSEAARALYEQICNLSPVSRTLFDQNAEQAGFEQSNGDPTTFRHLEERTQRPLELLMMANRWGEDLRAKGPNNMALKLMIENLAGCWEICFGKPPISDKARGLRDDPFLKLCQKYAEYCDLRLRVKGGRLRARTLTGLVAETLKARKSCHRSG